MVGRAAHLLLRAPKDANKRFNESERADAEQRVETLLWRAELFLDKYDPGHAEEVAQRGAARSRPQRADALVMLARVKLEQTPRLRRRRQAREGGARGQPAPRRRPTPCAPASPCATWTSTRPTRRSPRASPSNPSDLELLTPASAADALSRRRHARLRGGEARGLRAQPRVLDASTRSSASSRSGSTATTTSSR